MGGMDVTRTTDSTAGVEKATVRGVGVEQRANWLFHVLPVAVIAKSSMYLEKEGETRGGRCERGGDGRVGVGGSGSGGGDDLWR
jgi:hypothetical protein